MTKHVDTQSILTDCQHGPIGDPDPASSLASGKQTGMVVLDFSKAFDSIPNQRLMRKLHHYAVRGSIRHWISPFLSGHRTGGRVATAGVLQESVFGTLLFLFFYQRPARQDHFNYKNIRQLLYINSLTGLKIV